jgi:ribosomal-protein-alanine N-acetyltransferase
MTAADLQAVAALETASYAYPWTLGIFRDCLRVGYFCRVLEVDGQLGGYGILSHGAREAHVLNLCVREDLRGRGYGRMVLAVLIDAARRLEADTLLLEVRTSNRAAIALYQSLGFNEIGLRKGYYPAMKGREDALVLAMALGGSGVDSLQ